MSTVIVEVVIGLAFLFFLLSIVASALSEAISGALNLRGTTLHRGIANLITGEPPIPPRPAPAVPPAATGPPAPTGATPATAATPATGATAPAGATPPAPTDDTAPAPTDDTPPADDAEVFWRIYDHPLVSSYGGQRLPSYLSAASFRSALLDATRVLDGGDLHAGLARLPAGGQVGKVMTALARTVDYDPARYPLAVEQWYDRSMERVSGWYKRKTQILLFVIGFVLALAANANAGQAALRLWADDGLRQGLVAQARDQRDDTGAGAAVKQLQRLDFPVGWGRANRPEATAAGGAAALAGWLLTGIAVTFGAPFWFDVLNRVSNLRAAGRKPDSGLSPPEGGAARTHVAV